eukprot:gene8554-8736_t
MLADYGQCEYWNDRYQQRPSPVEWYCGFSSLKGIVNACFSKEHPVLQVGCGTSSLQEEMARSGYSMVDWSKVVISAMQHRHKDINNIKYMVSDCQDMPEIKDLEFRNIIDKGTLDALLCGNHGGQRVNKMLREVCRVLQPNGIFLLISLGAPLTRLPLLLHPHLDWKVSVVLVPKSRAPYQDGTAAAAETYGPFRVVDEQTLEGMPDKLLARDMWCAYLCKKAPLQLPKEPGQQLRLPEGWIKGCREKCQKLQQKLDLPIDVLTRGPRTRQGVLP